MATAKPTAAPIEVLPPEAQNLHPFNKPVQFNMQNTLQSPLFWLCVGMGLMWGIQYYAKRDARRN